MVAETVARGLSFGMALGTVMGITAVATTTSTKKAPQEVSVSELLLQEFLEKCDSSGDGSGSSSSRDPLRQLHRSGSYQNMRQSRSMKVPLAVAEMADATEESNKDEPKKAGSSLQDQFKTKPKIVSYPKTMIRRRLSNLTLEDSDVGEENDNHLPQIVKALHNSYRRLTSLTAEESDISEGSLHAPRVVKRRTSQGSSAGEATAESGSSCKGGEAHAPDFSMTELKGAKENCGDSVIAKTILKTNRFRLKNIPRRSSLMSSHSTRLGTSARKMLDATTEKASLERVTFKTELDPSPLLKKSSAHNPGRPIRSRKHRNSSIRDQLARELAVKRKEYKRTDSEDSKPRPRNVRLDWNCKESTKAGKSSLVEESSVNGCDRNGRERSFRRQPQAVSHLGAEHHHYEPPPWDHNVKYGSQRRHDLISSENLNHAIEKSVYTTLQDFHTQRDFQDQGSRDSRRNTAPRKLSQYSEYQDNHCHHHYHHHHFHHHHYHHHYYHHRPYQQEFVDSGIFHGNSGGGGRGEHPVSCDDSVSWNDLEDAIEHGLRDSLQELELKVLKEQEIGLSGKESKH